MSCFDSYRSRYQGRTMGQILKEQSDDIMNDTWWNDISSAVGYLYDYYHDSEPSKLRGLNSDRDALKTPIDVKVLKNASQTYEKDQVTTHIQLRPNQTMNVEYYKECFEDRYSSIFPIGLYIDIPDSDGSFNRWLIVEKANNYNVRQFPTFEILPCDKIFQYIVKGVKHQIAGTLRSQNSYNSGLWTDYKFTSPEDQQKFLVPLNRDTEKIFYDLRMIIDAGVLTEPRAWHVSKVNRISPNGIARITLAQDIYDPHRDYIELDEAGNVIGMWADYYDNFAEPQGPQIVKPEARITGKIIFSGVSSKLKVGGNYKKLSAEFYKDGEKIPPLDGTWEFSIDGKLITDEIKILPVADNKAQIKVMAPSDASYIGKVMTIVYITEKLTISLEAEIVAL